MSRALRRHPAKQAKGPRGRAAAGPIPRAGHAVPRREGRPGLLSWRPRFFTDIISELRKVVWPSRQDTMHLAIVVLVVAILVGAVLGGIDIGFGWIIDRTLLR